MDASLLLTVENLLQQKNKKNLLQTSSATIKIPSLSLSARSSPVSNKRHKFNISTASLASYSSQTNNNYASIMDSLDMESLEDLLRKVCVRLIIVTKFWNWSMSFFCFFFLFEKEKTLHHCKNEIVVMAFALNARNDTVSLRTRHTSASI